MSTAELFGFLSLALSIMVYVPYWHNIYIGEAKPHCFSWFVYGLVGSIAFLLQISDNAGPGSWAIGFMALNSFAIAIYGFFYGEKERHVTDWIAFFSAIFIIPIWMIVESAVLAVVLVCIIDVLATWPTFRKSIMKPWDEPISPRIIGVFRYGAAILALQNFSFITAAYLVTILILDTMLAALLVSRRFIIKKPVLLPNDDLS